MNTAYVDAHAGYGQAVEQRDRQPKQQDREPRHRARRQHRPVSLIIEVRRAFPHTPLGRWCGSRRRMVQPLSDQDQFGH